MQVIERFKFVDSPCLGQYIVMINDEYIATIDSKYINPVRQVLNRYLGTPLTLNTLIYVQDAIRNVIRDAEEGRVCMTYHDGYSKEVKCPDLGVGEWGKAMKPEVKKVIYNGPKTIVIWKDGTKTIVSCSEGDTYQEYAGFCAAYIKKVFGFCAAYIKKVFGSTSAAKKFLAKVRVENKKG